jgi:hypothetical protein
VTSTRAFVARLDTKGALLWSKRFGANPLEPGQVAVDNDGVTVLAGSYADSLIYDNEQLAHAGSHVYLLRLDEDGALLSMQDYEADGWLSTTGKRMVVDDEDNVIIAGDGMSSAGDYGVFLAKLTPEGTPVFAKDLAAKGLAVVDALTVDRQMQITLGGYFRGSVQLDDELLLSSLEQDDSVWMAQYSRDGKVSWSRVVPDADPAKRLYALTADPLGNLLMAGATPTGLFLRKLRSSGSDVWTRSFVTLPTYELALATDNDANVWLAGSFAGSIDWGDYQTDARGSTDGFLTRLSP